ncbi:MAG: AAA family ATPase [Planctomycetes bacterium]|nr:AAA family ATPase [Planctomycetota bacterium]
MTARLTEALPIACELRKRVLDPLRRMFIGKDEIIDVLGVCLAASEHAFLLGPPGTAKSAIVNELARRIDGTTFGYLLTRFTEPSELFGPWDLRRLRDGELVTNTAGMLPEASLVFLDELLNANSAILNSLLTALNERVFRRGRETGHLPLLMVVGASNHLPEDDALGALFDRFLLRVTCNNVPDDRLGEVLHAGWRLETPQATNEPRLPAESVRIVHRALSEVGLQAVHADLTTLVHRLRRAGIAVSDRRAVKLQRLVAASALLCGRSAAARSDLWVFKHIWDADEQREVLQSLVGDAIGTAGDEPDAHPAARNPDRPDPEVIARDLHALELQVTTGDLQAVDRARTQDRLRALQSRLEWVADATARDFLQQRTEALWNRLLD